MKGPSCGKNSISTLGMGKIGNRITVNTEPVVSPNLWRVNWQTYNILINIDKTNVKNANLKWENIFHASQTLFVPGHKITLAPKLISWQQT
jgi:hypothetical protein